jgi:glutamate synthase domain-containing protein 1
MSARHAPRPSHPRFAGTTPAPTPSPEAALVDRYRHHPGRGGCGVGAIADPAGPSHDLIRMALEGLRCMEHRGGALDDTGDGAGLLLATPRAFFERFIAPGRRLPAGHQLGVGVVFFPVGERSNVPFWQHEIDATLRRCGILPLGWRPVPVDDRAVGRTAFESRREVWHCIVGEGLVFGDEFARAMFRAKATIERSFRDLYLPSFAPKTLVYKGLATGEQLDRYYPDLTDPALETDLVVYHRRYSTNTFSNWYLAQPFRTLGHNGEINTIKANRNAVRNLEAELHWPGLLMPQGSDSADVDRVVEMFRSHGVSLPETLMRMMPAATADLVGGPEIEEIARFGRGVQRALGTLGAWEGPAALVATDGDTLVARLDRMGLRPLRYVLTRSGRVFVGSELGAHVVADEDIARTGQLDPGEALGVELRTGEVLEPVALLRRVVSRTRINFTDLSETGLMSPPARVEPAPGGPKLDPAVASLFGVTPARTRMARTLAETGKEPVTSMGYDRPLAVFSAQRPPLYKYCKQIVAVVTNPPLDPLREGSAFDLTVHIGESPIVHEDAPNYDIVTQYRLASPFLDAAQADWIRAAAEPGQPRCATLDCVFRDPNPAGGELSRPAAGQGGRALAERIAELTRQAVSLVKRGEAPVLCLSDRLAASWPEPSAGGEGMAGSTRPLPLPMLLVVGHIHNALVAEGLRRHTGLLVECGDVLEGHDAAMLIATGATALCPHVLLRLGASDAKPAPDKPFEPVRLLLRSLEDALKRVMSKMGICTVDGYRGSGLYEVVGLSAAVVDYYLPGIQSRIGGLELADIYEDIRHRAGIGTRPVTDLDPNVYRKEVWQALQETARGNEGAWGSLHATPARHPAGVSARSVVVPDAGGPRRPARRGRR